MQNMQKTNTSLIAHRRYFYLLIRSFYSIFEKRRRQQHKLVVKFPLITIVSQKSLAILYLLTPSLFSAHYLKSLDPA